jgi:hypothetical protein
MSATEKISITVGRAELGHAKRLASRLGVSLSAFITDAVRERVRDQARREAALEVLASFAPYDRATPTETQSLLEQWAAPSSVARRLRPTRHARKKANRKG